MTKLDNPVWFALSEQHRHYCLPLVGGKFYDPLYCPFGSFIDSSSQSEMISLYSKLTPDFYIVGHQPVLPPEVMLTDELICQQMVIKNAAPIDFTEEITLLNEKHEADLRHLINLVQPGFFKEKTIQLGNYYGIYRSGTLVAVAGERMKLDEFTELSAVVTHPLHTGNGYAKQLVTFVVNSNLNQQKIVFLHVNKNNLAAISLYEGIGFSVRRQISFWHIRRIGQQAERETG